MIFKAPSNPIYSMDLKLEIVFFLLFCLSTVLSFYFMKERLLCESDNLGARNMLLVWGKLIDGFGISET